MADALQIEQGKKDGLLRDLQNAAAGLDGAKAECEQLESDLAEEQQMVSDQTESLKSAMSGLENLKSQMSDVNFELEEARRQVQEAGEEEEEMNRLMDLEAEIQAQADLGCQNAKRKLRQMKENLTKTILSKGIELKGLKEAHRQCSRTKEGRSKIAVSQFIAVSLA